MTEISVTDPDDHENTPISQEGIEEQFKRLQKYTIHVQHPRGMRSKHFLEGSASEKSPFYNPKYFD